MPRRRTAVKGQRPAGTARRRLVNTASLLPLAIGLATTAAQKKPTPKPTTTAETVTAAQGAGFPTNRCALPFNETPGTNLDIDRSCGLSGNAKPGSAEVPQNLVKNNLCATGDPKPIEVSDIVELQKAADDAFDKLGVKYGNRFNHRNGPPPDRSVLQNLPAVRNGQLSLKEGDLVTFTGFLVEEHYMPKSASGSGETVNCKLTAHEEADIHIAVSDQLVQLTKSDMTPERQAKLCGTLSAEMIPHSRPSVWNVDNLHELTTAQHPVRITGQLFFDGSHQPCNGSVPNSGDPARISVWEIHPVYRFEICKSESLSACTSGGSAMWDPLSGTQVIQTKDDEGPEE